MGKTVIVIGGGIAGLTAGINLLQKGYKVTLIEKNNEVGGLCSGYFVNGHYIDACLHWLMGTNRKSVLHKEWANLRALTKETKIVRLPSLATFEYQGTKVTFYRNLNKTEKELIKTSPKDKKAIRKFINSVRDMGSIMGIVLKNKNLTIKEAIQMLPNSAHIVKTMRESRETYAKRFKHPAIQFAIKNAQTGYNNMFFFLDLYGLFSTGNADLPEGGAYYMIQRIKNRFLELGGELLLNTEINELLLEKNHVFAVKTNKNIINFDYFVSAIDPQYVIKNLLKNEYQVKLYDKLESTINKRPISSCFNVYITVNGDTSKIAVPTILNTPRFKVGEKENDALLVRPYHYDPKYFVKDGKTVVSLFVDQDQDDFNYFKSLSEKEYKKETKSIVDTMINLFVERYPEFKDKVELLSFFGPLELNEQVNTSYGSIQSYSFTDKGLYYSFSGKIRKIDNLYFCGQWNKAMGGTPTALLTGLDVCKQIIDDDKRK